MKPEYIGIGNFDEENYVYAYCKCPLSFNYAIKWPRIKDGKVHIYACTCENCGTEVGVISKSYGPEVYEDRKSDVLDKIRAEIEQTVSRYSISRERGGMGQVEWSDRLIKESEVLQIIDKYKTKSENKE